MALTATLCLCLSVVGLVLVITMSQVDAVPLVVGQNQKSELSSTDLHQKLIDTAPKFTAAKWREMLVTDSNSDKNEVDEEGNEIVDEEESKMKNNVQMFDNGQMMKNNNNDAAAAGNDETEKNRRRSRSIVLIGGDRRMSLNEFLKLSMNKRAPNDRVRVPLRFG